MHPFGGPVVLHDGDAGDGTSTTAAQEDMDLVRRALQEMGDGPGLLRIYRPRPTAAFSPRDTTLERYGDAASAMQRLGFTPVERMAGGQLAVYDANALIIDLVAVHDEPRAEVTERFRGFAEAIASALAGLSIDARIGELPGEYCPGSYSVNGAGRFKLAGLAQRIRKRAYHMGAVIAVAPSKPAKAAVEEAYRMLGLPFDPATFGSVADLADDLSFPRMREALLDSLLEKLDIRLPALEQPDL